MTKEELAAELNVIPVDYNDPSLPPSVRDLQPLIYLDGNSVCVLNGTDPQADLFGCGDTLQAALNDFQKHYEEERENSV